MNRRDFVRGGLAAGLLGHPLASLAADLKAADRHGHRGMAAWGGNGELNAGDGLRKEMPHAGIRARKDGLVVIGTSADLKTVLSEKKPGIVLPAEGGDFLEGKIEGLDEIRAMGVCHLQPVHYRLMEVGDISTQAPKFNGLSAFGKSRRRVAWSGSSRWSRAIPNPSRSS